MNGQRETANAYLVNGGDVSEGRNLGAGLVPNLDSIEEFRLITNSFDAEYGKFSGAVVNAITKSGTNGFHGDAFEFLRNDKLDAKNYFAPSKSELRRNQFGYAAGGPVIKNKIFWFSDYQGTRQVQGAETGLVSVPTAAERAGTSIRRRLTPNGTNGTCDATATNCVTGPYWAQQLSQKLGLRGHSKRTLRLCRLRQQYPVRVPERRDPAVGLVGAREEHPAVYPCTDTPGRYAKLFRQQPAQHRQRQQIRRAHRLQQPEDRKLVVVLPPRQHERNQRIGWLCQRPGVSRR